MNIHIQDNEIQFENNPETIEQLFNTINENLQEQDLQFSHLIIDDEEIYDNFDSYIMENIETIEKIRVIAMSVAEIVNETIVSTEQYVKNAVPVINKLADEFYQGPNENTWVQLTDLFEGIQWIIQSLVQINSIESSDDVVSDYEIWNEYSKEVSKLNNIIPELENAIVNKDNILTGDMLLYEIIPVFEAMIEKLDLLMAEAVN